MRRAILSAAMWTAVVTLIGINSPAMAVERLKVLIVDGQNNHNWEETTPYLRDVLVATGRFDVTVATTPPKGAPATTWDAFRPDFAAFDVLLSNYNGETWPEAVRQTYEQFVEQGGGVVNVHAANNPFPDWPRWNEMIGLAWRPASAGDRLVLDHDGNPQRVAAGEGPGAGHGPQYPFPVVVRDREHPVMQGLPAEWLHPTDELYHGQRGPALNMHVLATAYSLPYKRGTGDHEPMVWWIPYGQGRVFTTVLGHVGRNQSVAGSGMDCVGFQVIVCRGTEWAATGEVTLPLPANFPTAEAVSRALPQTR